jgi:hypothetical protein
MHACKYVSMHAGAAMMAQVSAGEAMDLVTAGLHLAAEDDAIKTRTHIPLPVDSFSARLDGMVAVRNWIGWMD